MGQGSWEEQGELNICVYNFYPFDRTSECRAVTDHVTLLFKRLSIYNLMVRTYLYNCEICLNKKIVGS